MAGWARPVRIAANSSRACSTALFILCSASWTMSGIIESLSVGRPSGVDGRSDLLTLHHAQDVSLHPKVEEDHRQVVVAGQADRGGIGNLEVAGEVFVVGEVIEAGGVRVLPGIGVVHTVGALLAHQQHV